MKTVSPLFVIVTSSVFVYTEGPSGQQKHSWFPGLQHNCSWSWRRVGSPNLNGLLSR